MQTQKKESNNKSIITFIVLVLFVSYFAVQISTFLSRDVKISGLRNYTTEDKTVSQMLIYKDEIPVLSDEKGGCDYLISNGDKVAVGTKIAVIYANMDNPEILNNIRDLELEIESLEDILQSANTFDYDISKLDESINANISDILNNVDSDSLSDSLGSLTELKKLINKRSLLDGNGIVTSERISSLQEQIDSIVEQNFSSMSNVYSENAGFFTSSYDGLEGRFPVECSKEIDVNKYNEYISSKASDTAPQGYIGSIVNGFSWTGSFKVPSDYTINAGDYIKIRLPDISEETMYVEVTSLSDPDDGEKVVTVFSDDYLNILTENRIQTIEIIDKTYEGLRITKDAVKTVDNVTGVFVLKGQILEFTEIEVLYSAPDYVIISAAEGYKLYSNDDVVISGKNLYDGKVVKSSV